jgi:hypothetical protein
MDYVSEQLGPDEVTSVQKHVLLALARHHSERYGTANLSLEDFSAEVQKSKRQLGRIFKKLAHVLEYTPGVGSGNYSQFRFLELEKATQRRHKADILDTAIRKDLNPDQKQKPPHPLSSKGGIVNSNRKLITIRQIRELRALVDQYQDDGFPLLAAIEKTCKRMLFPLDAAIVVLEESGHVQTSADLKAIVLEDVRKSTQRVSVA